MFFRLESLKPIRSLNKLPVHSLALYCIILDEFFICYPWTGNLSPRSLSEGQPDYARETQACPSVMLQPWDNVLLAYGF